MAKGRSEQADLSVGLELRIDKLEKSLARANQLAERGLGQMEKRSREAASRMESSMSKAVSGMNSKLADLGKGAFSNLGVMAGASIAGIFSVQSAQAIARYANQYRDLQNALKVAGLEGKNLESVFGSLSQIAMKQGTPLDALVQLYGRVAQSATELKASQTDLITFSEGIATALRVSGKSASEASGALLQLGQALGGNMIQAEEYNSLLDGAYPLLQAVAKGLKEAGSSVASLTKLVKDGKVPTQAFFRAALAGFPSLAEKADKAEGTVSQSMSRIGTAMTLLVGHLDETTGASNNATTSLNGVADAIQAMPGYIDAAARGLGALRQSLSDIGNSDVFAKLNKFLGVDANAANAAFLKARSEDITLPGTDIVLRKGLPVPGGATSTGADNRIGAAFDVTAGNPASDKMDRLGKAAKTAEVSLKDFASATDKAKLGAAPITSAREYVGLNETRDNDILEGLFNRAGMNVDPEKVKWCAAFVNAVLATNGVKGTGSLAARSFLDYGEKTDKPETGDIVVLKRGSAATAGHVGFFDGYDAKGNIRVLGGNQSDGFGGGVNVKSFKQSEVLGYRRIPGVETGGTPGTTVGDEISKRQQLADSYSDVIARAKQFTVEQKAEQAALGMTKQAAAAYRYEQQLLADAQQRGLTLSPEQRAELRQYAAGLAEIEAATERAVDSQAALRDTQQYLAEGASDFFSSIITGSASASEALQRLLGSLADAALQAAFLGSGPFGKLFGGGAGIFGTLFGGLFGGASISAGTTAAISAGAVGMFASGGHVRGAGTGTSDSIPAMLSNGEYVVNAKATAKHRALLEAVNSGSIPAFATGGLVGRASGGASSSMATQTVNIAPVITVNAAQGGDPAANADAARQTAKAVEANVQAIVAKELQRAMRPGGIMRGGR